MANSGSQQLCKNCQIHKCLSCGKKFIPPISETKRNGGKFCSRKCYEVSKVGKPTWNKGIKHTPQVIEKMKLSHKLHQGKNHSKKTNAKRAETFIKNKHLGNKATNWKGGKILGTTGYFRLYNPKHPNGYRKYVAEHRLIAEKFLGRLLSRFEVIHHINEIKTDNRPENLYVFPTRNKHSQYHKKPYKIVSNII